MNYNILSKSPLFANMNEEQIIILLKTITSYVKSFAKDECIYSAGESVNNLGFVLDGVVQIESIDLFGNRSILGISEAGDSFAESYACTKGQPIMVNVIATTPVTILFISIPSLFDSSKNDKNATLLIRNLLSVTAQKNIKLSMRIFHSSPKKIRNRLYSYFSEQMSINNSRSFSISLDRQQLADYLNVERTALSKELSKMKKEKLINYNKNHFEILVYQEQSFNQI